jgi:cell wall-associated NlpC family hydrolase
MSAATRSRKSFVAVGASIVGVAAVPAVALGGTPAAPSAGSSTTAAHAAAAGHNHSAHRSARPMRARLTKRGHAIAPANAPWQVRRIIRAANRIARTPYVFGGGHGSFFSRGYDCSGSVSFALHGAHLLSKPMTSGSLTGYGHRGRGKWVTIYAHGGHTYMVVAGLRFDTSSGGRSRWTKHTRSRRGFVARHPSGL